MYALFVNKSYKKNITSFEKIAIVWEKSSIFAPSKQNISYL